MSSLPPPAVFGVYVQFTEIGSDLFADVEVVLDGLNSTRFTARSMVPRGATWKGQVADRRDGWLHMAAHKAVGEALVAALRARTREQPPLPRGGRPRLNNSFKEID